MMTNGHKAFGPQRRTSHQALAHDIAASILGGRVADCHCASSHRGYPSVSRDRGQRGCRQMGRHGFAGATA
jgi:hypothetical protein